MEEEQRSAALQNAWNRFVDFSSTTDDLILLMESIKKGEDLKECEAVLNRIWDETAMNDTPLKAKELKQYKKEAYRLYAEYQNAGKLQAASNASLAKGRVRKLFYSVAAAVALCLLIPTFYFYLQSKSEQVIVNEAMTLRGELKSFYLPDSTKVTLNVGSRILYPSKFSAGERAVELTGEALFEVTADPDRPFIVKTERINIRVLGTVFDVKVYDEDMFSTISVASGKVEVDWTEGKALLEPTQQIKMDNATGHYERLSFDPDKTLAWTNEMLYFHRTPIREVVNTLNRSFSDIEIVLAEGDYPYLISGEHDNKSIETALKSIIYSTGLKCKKQGNKYTLFQEK